jgi:N-succinyldiaminopimelate aminotransferase
VNPNLAKLQPYPFERLRLLFKDITPDPRHTPINLGIGEPKHSTPEFILQALVRNLSGLASYPATAGTLELREAIAAWARRRYQLSGLDALTQVLPVNGSREALFALAQVVIDPGRGDAIVVCPNPFYQIYEGAALLAGAQPYYVNALSEQGFAVDYAGVPAEVLARTRLVYACSPGNPTGKVMDLAQWRALFELSDRHGFVIASDECYSEIYPDESRPPLGALAAAQQLGRKDYARLIVFSSLSKRSNVPGMRTGFVAGDAALIRAFLLYRTYHGSAMGLPVQAASVAAWGDEAHVAENRRLYAQKFSAVLPLLQAPLRSAAPEGGFYFWSQTPVDDEHFAAALYREYNVTVLPGSYLARTAHGRNPGSNFVRMALVAPLAECLEAAQRINQFARRL